MIPRYSSPEMSCIWSEASKFDLMLEVEIEVCKAMSYSGFLDCSEVLLKLESVVGKLDISRIAELEKLTKHDVVAFIEFIAGAVGGEVDFLHYGLTSSDVLDTVLAIRACRSIDLLLREIDALICALFELANKDKYTVCIGRSHGIHAEPTTYGLKFLRFCAEWCRNKRRLIAARSELAVCKLSGSVGNYAHILPDVEGIVARKFGLSCEIVASQVVPRDRHATFFAVMGVIASSIENIATEIRHLQRTEVFEVSESFSDDQKGSSSMPHKRNPVLSENLTGLSRVIRSSIIPALENVTLWHERDISHSSVERCIFPDVCIATHFAITRLIDVIKGLKLNYSNISRNLKLTQDLPFSQLVLLFLIKNGFGRLEAYEIVKSAASRVWEGRSENLFSALIQSEDRRLPEMASEICKLFDSNNFTKNVDHIFMSFVSEYEPQVSSNFIVANK